MFFDLFDSENLRNYLQFLMVCILFKGVGKNLQISENRHFAQKEKDQDPFGIIFQW